ncbi:MAG TPA: aldo/keto reductase [Ramlibacter sp.]|uniref:aldo/keto reductase n=1 Tax=Ramlibacter sp. TaxID=1917967 RepID=UPI002CCFC93E|nr:aldo/keto reductase [Ramlibacter sp.]HVZ45221.1 aldo/keto reductase [Ramlibacter sp.]
MNELKLGRQGLKTSILGLGCMGMSAFYGNRDEDESRATLRLALDLGITHFDTAEIYGPFANEKLIAKTLGMRRAEFTIATKFATEIADDGTIKSINGSAAYARKALERSLKHLETDHIDLYYLHRTDPKVPIEETIGAMSTFVSEGKVKYLGISEPSAQTIRRAHAVHPLTAVQSEYSLFERDAETNGVLDTVRELGIGFVAFSPLGRGLLTGKISSAQGLADGDARRNLPRFQNGNISRNLEMVDALESFALRRSATSTQVALAWVIRQGVLPIPGTKRRRFLEENVQAAELSLSSEDLSEIERIVPAGAAAGARNTEAALRRDRL